MHTHHDHVPPDLASLAYEDLARAHRGLDMLLDLYRERQSSYDERGLSELQRIVAFAREMQPTDIVLSGPVVLLTVALVRMSGQTR